ncbi:MAG: hypothetical protein U5Q16_13380 [Gammaproteobacteria bacterium]|nr:hypothetical protein [Gammaproteobacteria bacterium]
MTIRNYLLLCAGVTVIWVAALLMLPDFARTIEQLMLMFLSSNA